MAIYINYGLDDESDATLQGADWLRSAIRGIDSGDETNSSKFYSAFQELYLEAQENPKKQDIYMGKIFDLFLENSNDIFSVIPVQAYNREEKTQEVEGFFAIVMMLILNLEDEQHLEKSTMKLCDLFGGGDDHKELRLRLLMWLYNTFNSTPTIPLRYRIFQRILSFGSKQGLFDQIVPYLEYLENWMQDWGLKEEEQSKLFFEVSTYMRDIGKNLDAFNYLKQHVALFQGKDAQILTAPAIEKATIQLVKDAITLPMVMQVDDLLALDAVKQLRKSKQKELVGLLDIFLSGTFDDLSKFQDKNKALFKEHSDLSFEDITSKVRLLTLATLAQGKTEVPLDDVAKALQEQPDQVEKWVVKAISEDVIDGRIDQLNQRVLVKSNFQRKFGKEEWNFLDEKLNTWIDNLESLIKLVGVQKEREKMMHSLGA